MDYFIPLTQTYCIFNISYHFQGAQQKVEVFQRFAIQISNRYIQFDQSILNFQTFKIILFVQKNQSINQVILIFYLTQSELQKSAISNNKSKMNISFEAHIRNRQQSLQQKVLSRQAMQQMTEQQRAFAQNQFRRIYAEQMSKLMLEISNRKRVKNNLETLDHTEKQMIAQIDSKLKLKMVESDKKRHKNMQKKLELYKLNDQKWKNKMNDITRRFKSKNRQAYEKAEQYRFKAEKFFQEKKSNRHMHSERSKVSLTNYDQSRFKENKTNVVRINPLPSINRQNHRQYKSLKRQVSHSTTVYSPEKSICQNELDFQIKKHKEKAVYLQNQKQQMILKKALEKMDIIEIKRKHHKHESKVSEPTIPRKPKANKLIDTSYDRNKSRHTIDPNQYGFANRNSQHLSRSKQSLDNLIAVHRQAKSKKQQQDFIHRGEVLDKEYKKTKKTKILRMIKEKVHNLKLEAMKSADIL